MLQIAIILAWLTALGLMIYLATQAFKRRLRGGRRERLEFRKIRRFRRQHRFDEQRRRWVRKRDGVVVTTEAHEDRWFRVTILGWLLLILWEGYWISEIVERGRDTKGSLQLPYVFLFFVLVLVPLFVYWVCRRKMRRQSARLPIELPYR
ncbi:MAG: hypothetical protein WBD97_18430 [Pseudolabrys sp.]